MDDNPLLGDTYFTSLNVALMLVSIDWFSLIFLSGCTSFDVLIYLFNLFSLILLYQFPG